MIGRNGGRTGPNAIGLVAAMLETTSKVQKTAMITAKIELRPSA